MKNDLVERNKRYLDAWDGKNELHVGPAMLAFALEESTDEIEALREALEEVSDYIHRLGHWGVATQARRVLQGRQEQSQ